MIKIAKLNENVYQVDDNELPLENAEVRKLLNSYAGMSDVEANQWLDVLEEKKENTFEPKEANKGVIVNIYEVDYPAPADPNKETQEMAKNLDEYKDFVSQQMFPGSETEDVVVDLRQNIEKQKHPQKLNWAINEDTIHDYVGKDVVYVTKRNYEDSVFLAVKATIDQEVFVPEYIFKDPEIISEDEDIDVAIEKARNYSDEHGLPYIVSMVEKKYKADPQKLNWRTIPELSSADKRYIERTGRIDYNKLKEYYGMDLSNWVEVNVNVYGENVRAIIGKDVFRYLVSIQQDNEVGHHSVDYSDLVEQGLNPYDFKDVVQFAIENGPDDVMEDTTLDELVEDGGEDVIKLSSQKFNWNVSTNHQQLMDEAYELWQQNRNWSSSEFLDNLPSQAHRDAVVLGNLNYQIGNGGFEQWYGNNYGARDTEYLIRTLLPRINTPAATQVAELVSDARAIYRAVQRAERDVRSGNYGSDAEANYAEENLQQLYDQFDPLDDKYYEINDQFSEDCETYLQTLFKNGSQKLNWAQLPSMKVLRAIKVGNSWMWTNPNEMVIPEVLTNDHGFYGLDTRKGSQYAIVTSEDINMGELAKKDVLGFWGSSVPDEDTLNKLIKEKIHYYEILQEDLQDIPAGTIIEEMYNPEIPEWYRVIKRTKQSALKLNWRDLYQPGNPDDFFKATNCDRCGGDLQVKTMSWFNDDTICWECSNKEHEYRSKLPNYGSDLEGKGLPEELTPKGNWRNKLQWREDIPNFVWLPGIKVKFKENVPIENRTFEYDDAEHPYGEDYTIPINEVGTVVSRNDDPDNGNIEVVFDNLKKLFKEIPLICFKEDLELVHPNRLGNN